MTNDIVEADQLMGTSAAVIEKKARQLVYDSRYEVNGETRGKNIDPVNKMRMIIARISKSKAIPAVIARAKQMVSKKGVKEEYILEIQESASDSVANALYKVFVEGIQEEKIDLNYLEELAASPDKKYKIRVTDPKNGNSYVRFATREKITELRGKGLKVELTEYGEPREGERKRGEETARATGGGRPGRKKLDPVGREDSDVDNDGKSNDSNDKYIMKRRAAIGAAIEKRKTVSASYEPSGQSLDEGGLLDTVRSTVGDLGAKYGEHQASQRPGANVPILGDVIKGEGRRQGRQTATGLFDKVTSTVGGVLKQGYEPKGEMLDEKHKKGHKKHKKTDEPRWQNSDGDDKWYEPGQDVKKEDYLWTEGTTSVEGQNKKQITGNNVDNSSLIKIMPQDGSDPQVGGGVIKAGLEFDGPFLTEKAKSRAQQQFMGMVYARKKGKMKKGEASPEVEAAAKGMTKKEAKKFAKTKHKGLPEKVTEEMVDKEIRDNKAYREVIKNKFRALGAKNPLVVGDSEDLEKVYNKIATSDMVKGKDDGMCEGLVTGTAKAINAALKPVGQTPEEGKAAVQRLTKNIDVVAKPVKSLVKSVLSVGSEKNQEMLNKRRPTASQSARMENLELDGEVLEQHRPPAGWKPYGGGPEDKPIKSEYGNRFAGDDHQGGWLLRQQQQKQAKSKNTNKTA